MSTPNHFDTLRLKCHSYILAVPICYTKISKVNLSAFIYRPFHEDFTIIHEDFSSIVGNNTDNNTFSVHNCINSDD